VVHRPVPQVEPLTFRAPRRSQWHAFDPIALGDLFQRALGSY